MGAVEFAILAPVFFVLLFGIVQLGTLYFANAGLKTSVSEAARYATLFPRPSDAKVKAYASLNRFGLDPARRSQPTITRGAADGRDYIVISMSYSVPLNFVFFSMGPITLVETRRVFVHPV
jgi:Flp pilus assembly protein TadG